MRKIFAAAFKTVSGSAIALLSSAVAMKILALFTGPAGVGLFSLLRSTQQVASSAGGFGGPTALIQGLASRQGSQREEFLASSTLCFGTSAVVASLLLVGCAPGIAHLSGGNPGTLTHVIRWLALPVFLGIALFYLTAILNSSLRTGRAAACQAVTGVSALAFAYPAAVMSRHSPLAYVWLLSASLGAGVVLGLLLAKDELAKVRVLRAGTAQAGAFVAVAGTTLVSTSVTYATGLAVRGMVAYRFGLSAAGIFDVAWSLSMIYVMVVLMSFTTYYLPVLSGSPPGSPRTTLISQFFSFSVATAVPLVTCVVVLKPVVVTALYSRDFLPALKIMRWMLIADYFKIFTWLFGIPLVAFAELRLFLLTEIASNLLVAVFSAIAVFHYGDVALVGAGVLAVQVLYSCFGFLYCSRRHSLRLPTLLKLSWAWGLCLILAASIHAWKLSSVDWPAALVFLAAAAVPALAALHSRKAVAERTPDNEGVEPPVRAGAALTPLDS